MASVPVQTRTPRPFAKRGAELLLPDDVFDGRYRVVSKIGEGYTAEVFEAVEPATGRRVALELVREHLLNDAAFIERFERELALARKLDDDHLIAIYDIKAINGWIYVVSELVTAPRLDRVLAAARKLSWQRALHIIEELCAPLHAAHAVGLVHCRLSLPKIYIDTRPVVGEDEPYRDARPTDFARLKLGSGAAIVQPKPDGTFLARRLGNIEAMSPEQLGGGGPIDQRSDIYSLGVIAFELIAGENPFADCDNNITLRVLAQHKQTLSPPSRHTDVPPAVDTLIMTCLALDPRNRYPDVHALRDAIRALRAAE